MANNADNIDWINEHCLGNGSDVTNEDVGLRVPLNDSGTAGKPAALFYDTEATFSKGNWRFGSLNKAVVETYKINGGTFSGAVATSGTDAYKAAAGGFSLEELNKFVRMDMLYGYSGDSRNLNAGDGMSYRAYPTPVIASYTYVVKEGNANDFVNPDGSLTINVRTQDFLVMSHVLELTHALPYDLVYTARFGSAPGVSASGATVIFIKIQAGSKKPTHYVVPGAATYPSALTWTNLNNGEYLHTIDTDEWSIVTLDGAIGGTKTIKYWITTPNQLPVYNQPNNSDRVQYVTEAVYNPPAPAIASSRGGAYYDQYDSIDLAALASTCSQLNESDISNGGTSPDLTDLFLLFADSIAQGNTVYSEAYHGYTVPDGTYIYTTFDQEYLGVVLLSVEQYIVVSGGLGVIASVTNFNSQVGSSTCGMPAAPATQVWSTTMTKLGYSTAVLACAATATWTRYTSINGAIANGHTIYTSSAGTITYNGAGNFYTDGTNSFKISSSGFVSDTAVCGGQ